MWDGIRLSMAAHALACYGTFLIVLGMMLANEGAPEPIVALLFVLSPVTLPLGFAVAIVNEPRDVRSWVLIAAYSLTFGLVAMGLKRRFRSADPPGFPVLPVAPPDETERRR